ncbi:helix-turn-helix transcriptional regulator [Nordella sp. HKS 07]|uniref:winged helix-turn-helix transcriptional regulator n=1 Tax=Nordella sp. HKS 07 TaxID=2712222 RepID=UPI0013E17F77|nr:helix-turn-helix domain-containing protein [Nordella sp. HKS 07]QIG50515.1 helix-turn-helix transcriptional regulator [Nordella sp. HKS 07]
MTVIPKDCGFTTAIRIIGGKWKIDILCALNTAPPRFGRLRQIIPGISEKMLEQQLREMEADGLVRRESHDTSPPKVVYFLTPHCAALSAGVASLCQWGELHLRQTVAAPELAGADYA